MVSEDLVLRHRIRRSRPIVNDTCSQVLPHAVCEPVDQLDEREQAEAQAQPQEAAHLRYEANQRQPRLPRIGIENQSIYFG